MSMQGLISMQDDTADVYGGAPPESKAPPIAAMQRAGAERAPMTRAQYDATTQALREMLARLERVPPSCRTCLYLDGSGFCAKWEAKPPAEFTAAGCEKWESDGIPY